jgi:hypothetical protein
VNAAGGGVHAAEHRHQQRRAPWLWLLVAFQLVLPASYYLRTEPDDERFAWRMFSAVRVKRCQVRAFVIDGTGERAGIDLEASLHSGWVSALKRGRERVIERLLSQRCVRDQAVRTELWRGCEDAGQRAAGGVRFAMDCVTGKLTQEPMP